MDIVKLIEAMIDEEDLVKNKGGKLLYTVEKPDCDDWYLVYTDDSRPYSEEDSEDESSRTAEILLVKGDTGSWEIDCSFDADVARNQETLDYLTSDGRYDKWELMKMFDYDGKYSGLARHIVRRFRQLKGKGK